LDAVSIATKTGVIPVRRRTFLKTALNFSIKLAVTAMPRLFHSDFIAIFMHVLLVKCGE
jgi:hypothetical protein